jgi:hypothetical protein
MRNENRSALRAFRSVTPHGRDLRSGPVALEERFALNHIRFMASLEEKNKS